MSDQLFLTFLQQASDKRGLQHEYYPNACSSDYL